MNYESMKSFLLSIVVVVLVGCNVNLNQQNTTEKNNVVMTNGEPILIGESFEPVEKTASGETQNIVPINKDIETLLIDGTLVFGSLEAPHTLQVFTEYNCEYCDDFHNEYLGWLKNEYVQTGTLQIQVTLFGFEKYEASFENQRLLLCAAAQNKGGAVHHFLTNTEEPNKASLLGNNEVIGLDIDTFSLCINNTTTDTLVAGQQALIKQHEVTVVPTLILDGEKQIGLPYEADMKGWMRNVIK